MSAPAFARYIEHVALPWAIQWRDTLDERYPFRCEVCGRPCSQGARWCFHCSTYRKPCEHCGDEFESRRGKAETRFCGRTCSAKHTVEQRKRNAKRGRRI